MEVRTRVLPVRKRGMAEYFTRGLWRSGEVGWSARASL
jgi:hypothetical protein